MTDGRFDSGQHGEASLAPEDQALLAELLQRLDDRPGPARRRPRAVLGAMMVRALDALLATEAAVTRQPIEDLSAAGRAEGRIRRTDSCSGRRALLVLVGASLALFSAGALVAAVVVQAVHTQTHTQTHTPAPVRTTRALPTAPVVDAPAVKYVFHREFPTATKINGPRRRFGLPPGGETDGGTNNPISPI